ncbi:uncharacterized protein F5891DRAFT_1274335 [Suillus fuscotomentosus]|uniref:F-box domain-containing protein n=1 Tax=Suillus fuscotomentosus TaxID=1912939 RepID=A0AAD4EHN0_9AGAM|nr:uncharacterized protein F5891DRAFT_1274335 [Suillus fuscotomentosus]KAG1906415.1 hypothetical protein F5891DRAFT_1274335 [Suillus fuscotomentosus]
MTLCCPKVTPDNPVLASRAQIEIDDEIVALEERTRALRTCRNSLSPISSLPPELLSAIFVHHAQQTQCLHEPDNPDVLSWLIVGHICRHWRGVALGTPELWATPFLNSSTATDEMLTRSKMAPLNLKIGRRYRIDAIQKALMHIERLQVVSLLFLHGDTAGHRCIMEFIDKLSSCSAPRLKSLALDVGDKQTSRIVIPNSFSAPNLCKLQIKHCDLSWASSVLTGLTVLHIKKVSLERLPTLDELVSALRRMPALHTLTLEDALPTLSPHTVSLPHTSHTMNVQLLHLKQLRLTAKILEVANVLTCIESPTSEVRLVCRASSGDPNKEWNLSLPIISRALESCFKDTPNDFRQVPRSMQLSSPNSCIRLHYSTVRNPLSWAREMPCHDADLSAECPVILDFDFPIEMRRTILSDLGRLIPLGSIEAMYCDFFFACWDGFWADILTRGGARNLAYMYLRGPNQALEELLKSLRSRKHSVSRSVGGRSQQGPIFSPALSHLVFHDLEFDSSVFNWMRPSDFLDVLMDRVNEGRGLEHLTITSTSGIFARDVQLLREVVADVNWDEYESDEEYFTDTEEDYDGDFIDYEDYSDGYAS